MRHRRTRDIVIELTSLLDIVMILIFAVMIQNSKLVESSNQKLAKAENANVSVQQELDQMSRISEELAEELAEALAKLDEGDLDSLLEELHNAQNKLDAYEYMDDIVVVYNVGLENRYTKRYLTYGVASEENGETHEVEKSSDEEWDREMNLLKLAVNEFVEEEIQDNEQDKYIYVVFSVDTMKVYSKDFEDIDKTLKALETKYGEDKVRYRLDYITKEES